MSQRHENDYPIFDGNSGWTSPQHSGGGWSSAGGGSGVSDSEGVSYIIDVKDVKTATPVIDDDTGMRPKDGDTGAKPIPVKQFDLETIKQLIKDNPLIAAGIALTLGYVIFGKGGK